MIIPVPETQRQSSWEATGFLSQLWVHLDIFFQSRCTNDEWPCKVEQTCISQKQRGLLPGNDVHVRPGSGKLMFGRHLGEEISIGTPFLELQKSNGRGRTALQQRGSAACAPIDIFMDNKISLSYAALQYACQYQARGQSGRLSYHVHIPPPRLPREGNVPSLGLINIRCLLDVHRGSQPYASNHPGARSLIEGPVRIQLSSIFGQDTMRRCSPILFIQIMRLQVPIP